MATQLTVVNNVLRRLREDTVSSVGDNAYAQLIAMWVNDGIREVTDAYAWKSLSHEINVTVDVGTTAYDLSALEINGGDVPDSERVTTEESVLEYDMYNRPMSFMFDDSSDTYAKARLALLTEEERYNKQQLDRAMTNVRPNWFSLVLNAEGDGLTMTLWPIPSVANHIRINLITPQAELAIDGTADATSIIVPSAPVEAYVTMIAANERGEEIGEPGNLLERRYVNILGAAIEAASGVAVRTNQYESVRG